MDNLKRVYVWQLPVRIFHWINAACIVVLFCTGLYIGSPATGVNGEAAKNFLMGNIRYIHVAVAMIFTVNLLVRFYWFLKGNQYAKLRFWRRSFWQNFVETIRYYLFLDKNHSPHLGHNSLAQVFYLLVVWIGGFMMILTGFAMRAGGDPNSWLQTLFGWVIPLFGGENRVRMLHHLIAWSYGFFLLGHLYMGFRQDMLDRDGTVTSIITGYKYVAQDFPVDPPATDQAGKVTLTSSSAAPTGLSSK